MSQTHSQQLTHAPHLSPSEAANIERNPYKQDFPLLAEQPNIAYLDSAATTQRPQAIIDAQANFYKELNANALRGLYKLSYEATEAVEETRKKAAKFVGAQDPREIVFAKNTTELLNLLAFSLGRLCLTPEDVVVSTVAEHHSNTLPWQRACAEHGATLRLMRPDAAGCFTQEEIDRCITPGVKIVTIAHVSNVLGTIAPIPDIAQRAHEVGALCVVDAAQSAPHLALNVSTLGCDALVFSGHKILGPFGVGVLWAHLNLLEQMDPFLLGGEMIDSVTEERTIWAPVPQKFEAGTQDAASIAALGVAFDYLDEVGMEAIEAREAALMDYLIEQLNTLPYIHIQGTTLADKRVGVIAFEMEGIHPHDVASLLDTKNVYVRAGFHCAEPLHMWLDSSSTTRVSLAFYNDKADIDAFIAGLKYVWEVFHG